MMFLEALYNPSLVEDLSYEEILDVFKETAKTLQKEEAFVELNAKEAEAVFVGDTHGDFTVTKKIVKNFLEQQNQYLIFLGDYIDREPEPYGSLYNLLYLCLLKINFPERAYLLKGNHEANYAVECYPYEFEDELINIFGVYGRKLHEEAVSVFKQMPLMLKTQNGIVAAHGGFPLRGQKVDDKSRVDLVVEILWADPDISPTFRGFGIPKFSEKDLVSFLQSCQANCFIRGHDYRVGGKVIYSNRCITIFTCRRYASVAGITVAKVDLSKNINNAKDINLVSLTFPDTFE
ncbi:MAG: metallophosphoesterase family protein [Thermodesulfovibrionaceae bacterium]